MEILHPTPTIRKRKKQGCWRKQPWFQKKKLRRKKLCQWAAKKASKWSRPKREWNNQDIFEDEEFEADLSDTVETFEEPESVFRFDKLPSSLKRFRGGGTSDTELVDGSEEGMQGLSCTVRPWFHCTQ